MHLNATSTSNTEFIQIISEDMENVEEWGVTVIGADCHIPSGVVIAPKEMIDAETYNKEAGK